MIIVSSFLHSYRDHWLCNDTTHLVEWVGAGSPPGHEEGQANGLEGAGKGANGDGVKRTLLGDDLRDELGLRLVCCMRWFC